MTADVYAFLFLQLGVTRNTEAGIFVADIYSGLAVDCGRPVLPRNAMLRPPGLHALRRLRRDLVMSRRSMHWPASRQLIRATRTKTRSAPSGRERMRGCMPNFAKCWRKPESRTRRCFARDHLF